MSLLIELTNIFFIYSPPFTNQIKFYEKIVIHPGAVGI